MRPDTVLGAPGATDAGRFVLGGAFGSEPVEDSFDRLDRFAAAGGRLVETSYGYAGGRSKTVVGMWLQQAGVPLAVVTKVGHDTRGADLALTPRLVETQVRETLDALHLEAVDVLLYHCDDAARDVEELAETLVAMVEQGLARRVGASNWAPGRLDELAVHVAALGHEVVPSYHFSLAEPDPTHLNGLLHADAETLAVVQRHDLPLLGWAALARGFFSPSGGRAGTPERPNPFDTPANRARRDRCSALAVELGARPETVALAWTLQHPVWPTIGPRTVEQLESALEAVMLPLDAEQVRWLRDG